MNKTFTALYATLSAWAASAPGREKGATATEYALIVAGIAVLIVGAIFFFGGALESFWSGLSDQLSI